MTQPNGERLTLSSTFRFTCRPGIACFTHCCRDVNIVLTPGDVFRLKQRLQIPSHEFLDRYTVTLISRHSGLPVVLLKMQEDEAKLCPFVTPEGCAVYQDRPWACRMYPLDFDTDLDSYRIIADPSRCRGLQEGPEIVVEDWLDEQGALKPHPVDRMYNEATRRLEFPRDRVSNPEVARMYFLAAYDLDRFRHFVLGTRFLQIFDLPAEVVEGIKQDDMELARLAALWLKFGFADKNALPLRDEIFDPSLR
ncbi:YkgJ family cysteine cluster protein [Desulfothermobacter acidiphilus]|uniref:YkgJ family cysteine cluster protein n=1 Tax=Desulfothermobacter acidiphilus TaxID=1938353 RepID=UPI003F8CE62A